jgi:hypothetical protein
MSGTDQWCITLQWNCNPGTLRDLHCKVSPFLRPTGVPFCRAVDRARATRSYPLLPGPEMHSRARSRERYKTRPSCWSENPSPNPPSRLPYDFFLQHQSPSRIMKFTAVIPLILGAALQALAQVSDAAQAAQLVADLKRAPTQLARLDILKENKDVSTRSLSADYCCLHGGWRGGFFRYFFRSLFSFPPQLARRSATQGPDGCGQFPHQCVRLTPYCAITLSFYNIFNVEFS